MSGRANVKNITLERSFLLLSFLGLLVFGVVFVWVINTFIGA